VSAVARYSFIGIGTRIFVLFLLVVFLSVFGVVWFDILGLIDAKEILSPVMGYFGLQKRTIIKDIDDPLLLERERLKKQYEAFEIIEDDLSKKDEEIAAREKELNQLIETVNDRQKELSEKENSFNERQKAIENRKVNLVQTSEYLIGMEPAKAVKILEKMEDVDIIDIFRTTEEIAKRTGEVSMVSYWISQMQPDRAAELNRKMARTEGE
jgi:flagellar protein FlbB